MLVIPRDLFNHASLFNCYGRLWLELNTHDMEGHLVFHGDTDFIVTQDDSDGSISVKNIELIDINGGEVELFRPLNSRDKSPLWFVDRDENHHKVFTECGKYLSYEFKQHMNIRSK